MKKIKNQESLKKIINNILLFIVPIVFDIYFIYDFFDKSKVLSNTYRLVYILGIIAISILYVFFVIKIRKAKVINYPKLFLSFALSVGLIYIGICPLFSGNDEHAHFYRMYEITEGHFLSPVNEVVGSEMPRSLGEAFKAGKEGQINFNSNTRIKHINDMYNVDLNEEDKVLYGEEWATEYCGAALYSFVQYIPQLAAVFIGKILCLKPFIIGNLTRLVNLVFYCVVGYFAFKNLKKYQLPFFVLLTSPASIANAATMSSDGYTNILILLFLSLLFKYMDKKEKINLPLLGIVSALIASCKIVYFPIILLLIFIPKEKFKKPINKYIYLGVIFLIALVFNIVWLNLTQIYFDKFFIHTAEQKEFVLTHMFEYATIVMRTYLFNSVDYIYNIFFGHNMYSGIIPSIPLISFVFVILFLLSMLIQKKEFDLKKSLVVYGIVIIILALITTALYVQCTANFVEVGHQMVVGIQGRYFIPLVMLLIPFIKGLELKIKENNILVAYMITSYIALIIIYGSFLI